MPIIRKIMDVGNSRVISLPKSWLEFYEKETGETIHSVAMEVNKKLTIFPYILKKNKATGSSESSDR